MWYFKQFEQLTTKELYDIYKLRVDTFVVEQKCAYPEIDHHDLSAVHVFFHDGSLKAYARIIEDDFVHIGRVIVAPEARGQRFSRQLMEQVMTYIQTHLPYQTLHLQGQAHLEDFYVSYGFKAASVVYFEDMIPHIDMHRPAIKAEDVL